VHLTAIEDENEDDLESSLLAFGGFGFWLRLIETCFDEWLEISAVASFFHLLEGNKTQGGRINAVTEAGRSGTIVENVAKM